MLQNQYSCSMHFSTPKNPQDKQLQLKTDWTCIKVGFVGLLLTFEGELSLWKVGDKRNEVLERGLTIDNRGILI